MEPFTVTLDQWKELCGYDVDVDGTKCKGREEGGREGEKKMTQENVIVCLQILH